MTGALGGNLLWVFRVKNCGGMDRVIGVAQETGYGICAKFHDGDPADDAEYGFQEDFVKLAERCGRLGIPLVAWGYCYGGKYGNLDREVAAAALSLKSGAKAYVIDAEAEWEVPEAAEWAKRFMSGLLEADPGAEIGMTTFWNLRWHALFPARALLQAGCEVAIPQVCYKMGQRKTLAERKKMHAISNEDFVSAGYKRVYPAGEFSGDVTDTFDFLDIAGRQPHSFWLLDGYQDSASVKALRLFTNALKSPQGSVPGQATQDELTRLRQMIAEVKKTVKTLTGLGDT